MQLIKRLTQTLFAGSTSLTFTDSMINDNSIIDVKADVFELYPIAASQTGTSVTVQFEAQTAAHSILLLINNIVSLSDPELATLLDVDLSTLSEDDILTYDETTDKWVNAGARAAEDISYDNTDSGLTATNVQDAIDEVFQSVSDGKVLLADAITDKGVPTSATDTFTTMATNISNIPSGGSSLDDMLTALGFTKIEHATYTVVHGTITNNSGTQINGYANMNMLRIDVNANVKRVVAIVKADAAVINRAGCTSHRSALDLTSGYSQDPSGTRGLMYSITATDEAMIIGTGGYYQSNVTTRYVYLEVSSADVSANTFDVTLYWR